MNKDKTRPEFTKANDRQVGGRHYHSTIQHWDFVAANNLDYFQGQITKYVCRWKDKCGVEDLRKAQHFLEKYIELATSSEVDPAEPTDRGYVDQDR